LTESEDAEVRGWHTLDTGEEIEGVWVAVQNRDQRVNLAVTSSGQAEDPFVEQEAAPPQEQRDQGRSQD